MRIAVATHSARRIGGVEQYLSAVIPELTKSGHDVRMLCELERPLDRRPVVDPHSIQTWSVERLGKGPAMAALREWQPELIYAHGLQDPELEELFPSIAPVVFFAHAYHGTCISGAKTFKRPVPQPCDRRFGAACLVQYFPKRCGGLSPLTMVTEYRRQVRRLGALQRCARILTHSNHIRADLARQGLGDRTVCVPYRSESDTPTQADGTPCGRLTNLPSQEPGAPWRLVFVGRMDCLKGGRVLLEALPTAARLLDRPLHLTFAGDGPDRQDWEAAAERISDRVSVTFTGWLHREELYALLDGSDLLVMPSLWPEPFGLVGIEAGSHGLPAAAFATGGIPDWLVDGVNGRLAPGNPPTAEGLATAIVGCLSDPTRYAAMQQAARDLFDRYSMRDHIDALQQIFDDIVRGRGQSRVAGAAAGSVA